MLLIKKINLVGCMTKTTRMTRQLPGTLFHIKTSVISSKHRPGGMSWQKGMELLKKLRNVDAAASQEEIQEGILTSPRHWRIVVLTQFKMPPKRAQPRQYSHPNAEHAKKKYVPPSQPATGDAQTVGIIILTSSC
jgi:hypothetical protein